MKRKLGEPKLKTTKAARHIRRARKLLYQIWAHGEYGRALEVSELLDRALADLETPSGD